MLKANNPHQSNASSSHPTKTQHMALVVLKHLCMLACHRTRERATNSHNLILLIPMLPSGTTGDANEGSPQIPHSFERHTTVFVSRGQFDTADTERSINVLVVLAFLSCISPEHLME